MKRYIDMTKEEQAHYNKIRRYRHWCMWRVDEWVEKALNLAIRLKCDPDFIAVIVKDLKYRRLAKELMKKEMK